MASNDAVYEADRCARTPTPHRHDHSGDNLASEDRYHTGGEASDFGIQFPISGTEDPELYQVRVYHI